jgi:hypothetical protein
MNGSKLLALAVLVPIGACGSGDRSAATDSAAGAPATSVAAAGSSKVEEDLKDVAKYRLTMDKMDKWIQAQRNLFQKAKNMSPAEREGAMVSNDANASLDEMVANVDRSPIMKSAINEAGLSAREYTVFSVALFQAMMAESVLQMRPKDNQDSLVREMKASMENVRFIRDNKAEITRKHQALAEEAKQAGVTDQ